MTPQEVITLAKDAILLTILLSAPLLVVGMVVGVAISVFMAVTQIQEMTLTFVPKIVSVMLALLFFAPWMLTKLIDYTRDLLERLPELVR